MAKEVQYQSAGLMLDVIRKEYQAREKLFQTTSNRAGLTLVLLGVYLFILKQLNPPLGTERILAIEGLGAVSLSGTLYLVAVFFAAVSTCCLLQVLRIDRYRRIELDSDFVAKHSKRTKDRAAMELLQCFMEVNQSNVAVLEKKQRSYRFGIGGLIISIVFVAVYVMMIFVSIR